MPSAKVLLTQRQFADHLASHPNKHYRRDFYVSENYGDQPDQRRASALPRTAQLIKDGWDELFPIALKKEGVIKMRAYLRELSKPESLLKDLALPRLAQVDELVIKHYFAQAKVLLRKHDFAATRKMYARIISEYPDSKAAERAEAELPKVVPIAVAWYKTQGDVHFKPRGHEGVAQTKALGYFQKMYEEDPDGGKADYAQYYWARSLGTEGKFKQALEKLSDFEDKFPRSELRPKALFLAGFLNGDNHVNKIALAAQLMEQVAERYPKSPEAPEALWYGAFYYAQLNQFPQAISCLEKLQQYPQNKHTKHTKDWLAYFQHKRETGGQWP